MNFFPCVDSLFPAFIKEFDEICHLRCNECFEFITILQYLRVMEEKSCRRYSFSIKDNFLLKSENSDIHIFKLFSVIECQGG